MGKEQTKTPSSLSRMAFSVIRLGFAKVRCFAVKSYALLSSLLVVKVLVYN